MAAEASLKHRDRCPTSYHAGSVAKNPLPEIQPTGVATGVAPGLRFISVGRLPTVLHPGREAAREYLNSLSWSSSRIIALNQPCSAKSLRIYERKTRSEPTSESVHPGGRRAVNHDASRLTRWLGDTVVEALEDELLNSNLLVIGGAFATTTMSAFARDRRHSLGQAG